MALPGWCSRRITSPSTNSSVGTLYALIRMVARGGQSLWMLWRSTCLFREWNALLVSARCTASDSKAVCTACTVASIPEICSPHSWRHPEIFYTSSLAMESIALEIICLAVYISSVYWTNTRFFV